MKLESVHQIDGRNVCEFGVMGDIKVYELNECTDTYNVLFFVKGKTVIKKLVIEADCGQNVGFISILELEDI